MQGTVRVAVGLLLAGAIGVNKSGYTIASTDSSLKDGYAGVVEAPGPISSTTAAGASGDATRKLGQGHSGPSVVRDKTGKGLIFYGPDGQPRKTIGTENQGDRWNYSLGDVSRNGEYAAHVDSHAYVPKPGGKMAYRSQLRYFNRYGELLWKSRDSVYVYRFDISHDGKTVALVEEEGVDDAWVSDEGPLMPHPSLACVRDDRGRLLMQIGRFQRVIEIGLSPNGKYGTVHYQKWDKTRKTSYGVRFFDIRNSQIHDLPDRGNTAVTDSGECLMHQGKSGYRVIYRFEGR